MDLPTRIASLGQRVAQVGTRATKWSRLLARRLSHETLEDPRALDALEKLLGSDDLAGCVAQEESRTLATEIAQFRKDSLEALRFELFRDLAATLAADGVELRLVDEKAVEYRAAPFTIQVDFQKLQGRILYARQPVSEPLSATATALAKGWREARRTLVDGAVEPARFRETLLAAHRALLARRTAGKGAGDNRVDLVDLWPEVAIALQPDRFFREPSGRTFADYPRWRFAADLARLRHAGLLGSPSDRISLGSATAGSTEKKSRVLWIEDESGAGQYYLTFHVQPVAGDGAHGRRE